MFSIIIPIYNEQESIKYLIEEIYSSLKEFRDFEIIIVNDFSSDDSLEVLKTINKNIDFKIINNKKNEGQSFSINNGIMNSKFDIIITLDGDGQNNPADIPNLLKNYQSSNELKLVGGIRVNRKDNMIKILSSKTANFIRSNYLNDNCIDTGCSLKVFDKKIFLKFPYFDGIHRFLPALFNGYGYKTNFINVDHRPRVRGYSKYGTIDRLFKGITDMIRVKKIIKHNKNNNNEH